MRFNFWSRLLAIGILLSFAASSQAAPYASNITVTGTTVNYILNQDADALEISINGGAFAPAPDGVAKGAHTFTLGAASDTFAIRADKTELGFTTASGGTIVKAGSGIAYDVPEANGVLVFPDTHPTLLNRFNSPRGVGVNMNPNTPNFGTTYITNSVAGAVGGRTLVGEGLYALRADQSDAFGFGDTAQHNTFFITGDAAPNSANTPYKLTVASNGEVYVAGFGDEVSGVYRVSADLTTLTSVFAGATGPTALPPGQNHGSVLASYITGSSAGGDLVVYTLDEDLSTLQVTGSGSGTDTNKLWQYNIGAGALPHAGMPTPVASPLISGFSIITDVDRGADGKWYLSQNRSQPANTTGIFVTDASGNVLWASRLATAAIPAYSTPAGDFNHNGVNDAADYVIWRKQQGTAGPDADADLSGTVDTTDLNIWRGGNPALTGASAEIGFGDTVNDLYSNVFGIAVSPDQKYMAALHNNNTISVTPLVSGIPDITQILAIPTTGTISARDIAWDAAGNLHYVSSGQGLYRVLAPGGHTQATTAWNGTTYTFNVTTIPGAGAGGAVPEPSTLVLLLASVATIGVIRRRVR